MTNPILDRIKSRGYWRINFEPLDYDKKLKTLGECKDIIEKNTVQLRGWDYPHFPRRNDENASVEPGNNFYEGKENWNDHIEFWRMYQSGQFLHYLALRDDWHEYDGWGITTNNRRNIQQGEIINITGEITYELTEIFEFLSRLAKKGVYDGGVRVTISLHNTKGRQLAILDPGRFPLMGVYKTSSETIEFSEKYTKDEVVDKSKELAFDAIIYILDRFGWHNPSSEVISRDQGNLLSGRP